jgi:hypothetical protein
MGVFAWIGVALVAGVFVPHLKAFWQAKFRPVFEEWKGAQPAIPMPEERERTTAA